MVCRKCIYKRFSDDEVDTCPVCDIDLGCVPVEKLRLDHNLQDIRAKIFPFKRRKVEPSEVISSVALPAKRKERSLSALVISTPKIPTQTGSKPGLHGCGSTTEEAKTDEDCAEDRPISSIPPESLSKISQRKRQEPSDEHRTNGNGNNNGEIALGKTDSWTQLNCLVEAAYRTKSSEPNSEVQSLAKSEPSNGPDFEPNSVDTEIKTVSHVVHGNESKEHDHGIKVQDDNENCLNPVTPPVKRRRLTAASQRKEAMADGLSASAQLMLDAAMNNRRNCSVWFSLVATTNDKNVDTSLPQIPACYLRIKDSKMLVSSIQKYIVKKLELSNENEVEIMCRGEPVVPTLQLQKLVDLWFMNNATTKKVAAAAPAVGSSAKEFVMVLSYCRKVQTS
ncbi:E3 ubiquitin protein ligase DRIP2 [Linum perenne]